MNKSELITIISENADISRAAAGRALDSLTDTVASELRNGGTVALVGFGSFSSQKRKARTGRNPRTGEVVKIAAKRVPKFTPGKYLKDHVALGK